jgi:hypothetical protein
LSNWFADDDADVVTRLPQRRRHRAGITSGMGDEEEDYDPTALVPIQVIRIVSTC